MQRSLLLMALILFSIVSGLALWQGGIGGIIGWHVHSIGGAQVFSDLVIALSLAIVWMWRDAKTIGRNVWPWIALTLATGSFGPLLYLLTRTRVQNN